MPQFRKKPVVISAEQWFPPHDPRHKPIADVIPGAESFDALIASRMGVRYYVDTLEGAMRVSDGDWIITGVNGEKYPCKPDIFEKTYDPA